MTHNLSCISLEPNDVHLWIIDQQKVVNANLLEKYIEALSTDEKSRFTELKSTRHQQQFVITRASLRFIIAQYKSTTINDIPFSRSEFGKPLLNFPDCSLNYNLSHSSDKIVIAFTKIGDIGVDIEFMKNSRDMTKIAKHYFHEQEQIFINKSENQRYLYRLWTLKEAYTKATGDGLKKSFNKFYFEFNKPESPGIVLPQGDAESPQNWLFQHWFLQPNFSLAVALKKNSDTSALKVCAREYIPLQSSSPIDL